MKHNNIFQSEVKTYKHKDSTGLLLKTLKCGICGSAMVHTYVLKKDRIKYRYYICTNAQKRGATECPNKYVNAQTIENAVVRKLKMSLAQDAGDTLKTEREALLSDAWDTLFIDEKRRIVKAFIKSVYCDVPKQAVSLLLNNAQTPQDVEIRMKTDHHKIRAKKEREFSSEPGIRKALIFAHQIKKLIEDKKISHPRDICPWTNIQKTRLDQIMNMHFLSPEIQEEILSDNPAINNLTERGIRPLTAIAEWDLQIKEWKNLLTSAK